MSEANDFLASARELIDLQSVRVALDVGSRDAKIALALHDALPHASVYAFECNPDGIALCTKNIGDTPNVHLVTQAVSDTNGFIDFYAIDPEKTVTTHADGNIGASSTLPANPEYPYEQYVQKKIQVESVTLKDWAARTGIRALDVVWMDLQGGELKALTGMGDLLSSVKLLYTEVEYRPVYTGQPLYWEIRRFLLKQGFVLARRYHSSKWSGDVLFVRRELLPLSKRLRFFIPNLIDAMRHHILSVISR